MSRCEKTMQGMLLMLSGVLLCSCATSGPFEQNVAGPGPAEVERVEKPGDAVGGKANERRCAAAQHRALIGRPIEDIDTDALPRPLRVYRVGSRITMDYRPDRMNVVVGADGRVVKVKCG